MSVLDRSRAKESNVHVRQLVCIARRECAYRRGRERDAVQGPETSVANKTSRSPTSVSGALAREEFKSLTQRVTILHSAKLYSKVQYLNR